MIAILLFVICTVASGVGAIVGAGGGVIIKPVVDLLGLVPVATLSFLSGCTVFAMSCASLLRSRGSGTKLETRTTVPLAVGSALGGVGGKLLLDLVKSAFSSDDLLGGVQSAVLAVVMVLVFVYLCRRAKIASYHVKRAAVSGLLGVLLGLISSFLGIGGGPYIVALLFLAFSMDAKQAARNSIFIIMCSQGASILFSLLRGSVPPFSPLQLICMAAGGVLGGILGAMASKRMNNGGVETLMKIMIAVIFGIAVINCLRFLGAF